MYKVLFAAALAASLPATALAHDGYYRHRHYEPWYEGPIIIQHQVIEQYFYSEPREQKPRARKPVKYKDPGIFTVVPEPRPLPKLDDEPLPVVTAPLTLPVIPVDVYMPLTLEGIKVKCKNLTPEQAEVVWSYYSWGPRNFFAVMRIDFNWWWGDYAHACDILDDILVPPTPVRAYVVVPQ